MGFQFPEHLNTILNWAHYTDDGNKKLDVSDKKKKKKKMKKKNAFLSFSLCAFYLVEIWIQTADR